MIQLGESWSGGSKKQNLASDLCEKKHYQIVIAPILGRVMNIEFLQKSKKKKHVSTFS